MNLDDSDDFKCCICFDVFGEGPRCPRVLSCGHTYCHACLEKLLVRPKPFCPTCKVEIRNQRVELIPVNYIIKSYLAVKERDTSCGNSSQAVAQNDEVNEFQSIQRILKFTKTSAQRESKYLSEGYCEKHKSFKLFRCMTCDLWVCGVCVALSHKQCRTLLVKEALAEMKDGISQKIRLEREFQKSQTSTADRLIKFFEDRSKEMTRSMEKLQQELKKDIEKSTTAEKYLDKVVSWKREQNKCCDKLQSLNTLVLMPSDYSDFTKVANSVDNYFQEIKKNNLRFQIQKELVPILNSDVIKLLCERGAVYSCHQGEQTHYGKVEIRDGSVWVHSFCTQRPDIFTVLVPFQQLQRQFGVLATLPQRAFLKMSCEDSDYGDVVIATDRLCSRTKNFLLRCDGINRHSYKGCQLLYTRETTQELIRKNFLLKARKSFCVCEVPTRGFVYGFAAETNETVSDFFICIEDASSAPLLGKFGEVKTGMDVMQKVMKDLAAGKKVTIKDCGIILQ